MLVFLVWSEHDLEGVLVSLVQTDIIVVHIRLQHCTLVDLFMSESEDGDAVPKAAIDIYQIESLKLLSAVLLLCSAGEPLLDEKCCPLGKVLWVLVVET